MSGRRSRSSTGESVDESDWRIRDDPGRRSRDADLQRIPPEPILFEDYSQQKDSRLWARDAGVPSYEIVDDSYVMWHVKIVTLRGGSVSVYRRYSEFLRLHDDLVLKFPLRQCQIPDLPAKALLTRFEPHFLEQRRRGLDYFIKCVILSDVFSITALVKSFCSVHPQQQRH